MSNSVSFLTIGLIILVFNYLFNKFNLIRDKKSTSFHKKFIENKFEPPFSGGIFIIFTIIIYLNVSVIFKFFLLTIFFFGFFLLFKIIYEYKFNFYFTIIYSSINYLFFRSLHTIYKNRIH